MPKVITANELRTGAVVYLTRSGAWVTSLAHASPIDASDEKDFEDLARKAVERNEVTAVYAFDVKTVDGAIAPTSVRERIRAAAASPREV